MTAILSPAARAATFKPAHIERFPADDRAAWLKRREQDVTASAIAALLPDPDQPDKPSTSAHPYMTAYRLYGLKTGAIADDEVEPKVSENSVSLPPMIRGTVLEPVAPQVLTRYLRPTWTVEPAGFYYRDPTARIGATPDFFAVDPAREGFGSVQVKTCDQLTLRRKWTIEHQIVPPLFIVVQAVVEAALTGAAWCSVAVLATGFNLELHLIDVPIHLGIMERLKEETAHFWRLVEAETPPDPDYVRDAETIKSMYPTDNGRELDLRSDNHLPDLLATRDNRKAVIKEAEAEVDQIDTEFKHRLGSYEAALLADGRRVTWKTQHRRAFSVEASSSRVLRFSKAR